MKVGSIRLDVDETSLTSDTIIINTIEVVAPEINYEKSGGNDNFKTILNNVKNSVTSDNTTSKGSPEVKTGKKIIINNFIVRDGKVSLIMPSLGGRSLTASLPDIHLKGLGKGKRGCITF